MWIPRDTSSPPTTCKEGSGGTDSWELSGRDVLPGEEDLHEQLQRELMDGLARSHQSGGLVIQIEAKLEKGGCRGMFRSIEAAPGRYSCELLEISPADDSCVENRFFTLVSPEDEPSRASILILAKATALLSSPHVRPVEEDSFEAAARAADGVEPPFR